MTTYVHYVHKCRLHKGHMTMKYTVSAKITNNVEKTRSRKTKLNETLGALRGL